MRSVDGEALLVAVLRRAPPARPRGRRSGRPRSCTPGRRCRRRCCWRRPGRAGTASPSTTSVAASASTSLIFWPPKYSDSLPRNVGVLQVRDRGREAAALQERRRSPVARGSAQRRNAAGERRVLALRPATDWRAAAVLGGHRRAVVRSASARRATCPRRRARRLEARRASRRRRRAWRWCRRRGPCTTRRSSRGWWQSSSSSMSWLPHARPTSCVPSSAGRSSRRCRRSGTDVPPACQIMLVVKPASPVSVVMYVVGSAA